MSQTRDKYWRQPLKSSSSNRSCTEFGHMLETQHRPFISISHGPIFQVGVWRSGHHGLTLTVPYYFSFVAGNSQESHMTAVYRQDIYYFMGIMPVLEDTDTNRIQSARPQGLKWHVFLPLCQLKPVRWPSLAYNAIYGRLPDEMQIYLVKWGLRASGHRSQREILIWANNESQSLTLRI